MTSPVDRDLIYRVKDVSDALKGRIDSKRFDAAIPRLTQAADHLGAAAIGSLQALRPDRGPRRCLLDPTVGRMYGGSTAKRQGWPRSAGWPTSALGASSPAASPTPSSPAACP